MTSETIVVKSEGEIKFEYVLEQPENLAESINKFTEAQTFKWLLAGRKADINAKQWANHREKVNEKIELNGKSFKVPKELAAILRQAGVAGVAA